MKSSINVSVSFDKSEFKDILILQMVNHMKDYWDDNEVIELFLNSSFNFIEADKSKPQKVIELISVHKSALKSIVNTD